VRPKTVARLPRVTAAALPAFGQASLRLDSLAPNKSNDLRTDRFGIAAALPIAGTHMTSKSKTRQGGAPRAALKAFLSRISLILLLQVTPFSASRAQAPEADSSGPVLTLDEAIRIATGKNRDIQISSLEITKAKETVAQAKTNYLPKLDMSVLAGVPLQPLNFTVPAGTFGTYSATGPIPAKDSNIHSPVRFGAVVNGSAAQPLTQIYKVSLAVKQARLGIDLAKEGLRGQEQETVRQVKEAYYQVAQLQAQVASAKAGVKSLVELSALTDQRLAQQTVLESDSLTVNAKVKQQRYRLLTLQNAFELQKQNLNRILARDLRTAFSVEMQPFGDVPEWDLDTARKQALDQRPELHEARLQTKIAAMDVRRERAKYIPDVSLAVNYVGFQNVNFLPQNVGTAGLLFQWQPFDWGFKKHRIQELKATTEQKETTEQDVQQRVLLDVEDKFRKLGEARLLIDALTDQRQAEQAKLREVSDRYNQQSALLPDLLQQQAAVTQAEAQYQQALAGFWTARAEFEKAIGAE
jgi:outer membrane protein TolC